MYTKPNQRVIVNVEEAPKIDSKNTDYKKFVVSRLRGNEEEAMSRLNYSAFKLWMCFSADAKGFQRAFSPTFAEKELGMSQPSARSGFNELLEKGYLVQKDGNVYEFHQVPPKKMSIQPPRRRIIDNNGEVFEMTYQEFKDAMKDSGWNEDELKATYEAYELI